MSERRQRIVSALRLHGYDYENQLMASIRAPVIASCGVMTSDEDLPQIYQETGYCIGPRIFDAATVSQLRTACLEVLSGADHERRSPYFTRDETQPTGGLRRAFNAQFVDPVIRDAISHPELTRLAARLMGVDAIRLWYTQVIEKPAYDGRGSTTVANVGWHQDYRYWQCCDTSRLLTAWIALQDTTLANGAMRVVVGSNKWGLLQVNKGFNTRELDDLQQTLQAGVNEPWIEAACTLQAGGTSFHNSLTLHGSGPNYSSEPRLGIAVHLMPSNTRHALGNRCHESLTFLRPMPAPGEPFDGEQWPIL